MLYEVNPLDLSTANSVLTSLLMLRRFADSVAFGERYAGASPELVERIHAATVKALADPEVRKQFDAQGLEAVGMPPAEFAKFVAGQSALINGLAKRISSGTKK